MFCSAWDEGNVAPLGLDGPRIPQYVLKINACNLYVPGALWEPIEKITFLISSCFGISHNSILSSGNMYGEKREVNSKS